MKTIITASVTIANADTIENIEAKVNHHLEEDARHEAEFKHFVNVRANTFRSIKTKAGHHRHAEAKRLKIEAERLRAQVEVHHHRHSLGVIRVLSVD